MKKYNLLLLFLLCVACSQPRLSSEKYEGQGFFFRNQDNTLYDFSGESSRPKAQVENLNHSNNEGSSHLSSTSIVTTHGISNITHDPKQIIKSAVNGMGNIIYIATNSRQLIRYNQDTNKKTILTTIYPIPKQMVYDKYRNKIHYHDGKMVYTINLSTLVITKRMTNIVSIQSIAHHVHSDNLYLSKMIGGDIYIVLPSKEINLIHKTLSAAGSSIAFDSNFENLYYSKSNGRDTSIMSLNIRSGQITKKITLFNVPMIHKLVLKE